MAAASSGAPTTTAEWNHAVGTGLIRVGAGAALWHWRDGLIRLCGGSTDDGLVRGLFRFWAVRDVAVGVATLAATRPGGNVRQMLTSQGVADTVDTGIIVGLVASGRLKRVQGVGAAAMAAVTAAMEYAAALRLRRD